MNRIILILILCLGPMIMAKGQEQQAGKLLSKAIYQEEVNGELDEAINTYQLIVQQYPDDRKVSAEALLHLGICYEKIGMPQAYDTYQDIINKYAEQQHEVALARKRMDHLLAYADDINEKAEQHLDAGNELFRRWEYESAIKEYEKVIELRPNTLLAQNAHYCIGQSYFRAGQYDAALTTFEELIKDFPESNIAPVTKLMMAQVQHAMKNNKNPETIKNYSDENTIVDPETGITYTKIKTFTGESDIIAHTNSLSLSPNGEYLLCENIVLPMNETAPFELIDRKTTGIEATRGTWSPDGLKAAFYSGDAICVVPVSPETGRTTGPLEKIHKDALKWASNPGWSPDGEKLTFYGSGGDIWTISADGSTLNQITRSMDRENGPAWSPDGKTIAYEGGKGSIWLYSVEEGKSSELADTRFLNWPVWSPDGKWLLSDLEKLHCYNLNDKSKFEFSPPEEVGDFFSWSPEGNKMLFFRTSYHGNSGLKVASTAGGPSFEPVPLLTNWGNAVWSDNSKLIAVQGEDEKGNIAIRIVPLAGGESYVINLNNLVDGRPFPFKISSDLKKLLFTVDRADGAEDLFVVSISAEEARTIGPAVKIFDGWYRKGAYNVKSSWSSEGNMIALIHMGDIWIAFANGDQPIQVTNTPEKENTPIWTPDGKSIYFNSLGWHLIKTPGPEGKIMKLLDEGSEIECSFWNIDFSPDNTRFAILSDGKINIISLNGSTSNKILEFKDLQLSRCYNLTWSPDGNNLAFIGIKETDDPDFPDGISHIYIIPAKGGKPISVAQDDDEDKDELSWSPDGKWIGYSPMKSVKIRPESTVWEADFEEVVEKLQQ